MLVSKRIYVRVQLVEYSFHVCNISRTLHYSCLFSSSLRYLIKYEVELEYEDKNIQYLQLALARGQFH